jgi:hypothetical protein
MWHDVIMHYSCNKKNQAGALNRGCNMFRRTGGRIKNWDFLIIVEYSAF